nr:SprB repeat-containing protein [uncultured Flavobacterium sp.]
MKKHYLLLLFFIGLLGYSQTNPSDVDTDGARTIKIERPKVLEILGTSVNATIINTANGRIDNFKITGGTKNYTQTWTKDNGSFDTPTSYTSFLAGKYDVYVIDANGCQAHAAFIIDQPQEIEATIATPELIKCYGEAKGTLTASAKYGYPFLPNGVVPDYKYEWFGTDKDGVGENKTFKTDKIATNLAKGYYKVKVTDEAGHSVFSKPEFLDSNDLIEASGSISHPKCSGDNGSITLTIKGGKSGYNIIWKNSSNATVAQTTATENNGSYTSIVNLASGSYTYIINDAVNCSIVGPKKGEDADPFVINAAPDKLEIKTVERTQPSSKTALDGQIKITAIGGTLSNGTYTYKWTKNGNSFNANTNAAGLTTGLGNGEYIVTVTDANDCFEVSNKIVLDALNVTIEEYKDILCNGEKTGTITANPTGGSGSVYYYNWFLVNGSTETELKLTTKTISNLASGNYRVKVTDGTNPAVSADQFLDQPAKALEVTRISTNISCSGLQDGKVIINASGGKPNNNGTYIYTWKKDNNPFGLSINNSSTLAAGDYEVTVIDANNCSAIVLFKDRKSVV